MEPAVSIVIPAYNEEEALPLLLEKLDSVIRSLPHPSEVVVVDDGSRDRTPQILKEAVKRYPWLRVFILRRNFGQSAALTCGIENARGKVIVTLDADLQNDPEDIPRLLEKIEEGYDVVSGWRRERRDPFLSRRLPSRLANWLIGRITGVKIHDYGCTLKAYRREVIQGIPIYGELHRFIPVLTDLRGAMITEIPVRHHPRRFGKSKYGISRTYRVLLDLFLMFFFQRFATRPLHFFGLVGLVLSALGFSIELYLSFLKLVYHQSIGQRPLLLLGALLLITGVNLLGTGLLAELLVRTYYEGSGRKIYSVRERLP
ncbi:glycosyltransferase family 2 protein [Thermosulfurimonas sp. F29]|uniref:glycosyltransferase family 2 protein n=1 Tax=Thermosulfurimonas sp. F29 TaxID=2867247 RepID=UPI001C830F03|nr:glycosyltransferase family 2 protein [Thermosulfurimonas sp. F29]MBX6422925.1 glycosyltransferase family 2 protein [Thermosulfurimonas sp. F29]